jgi:hypothetical protein
MWSNNFPGAPDHLLKEDEEIIGFYGSKDKNAGGCFASMGFIVWTPPKY